MTHTKTNKQTNNNNNNNNKHKIQYTLEMNVENENILVLTLLRTTSLRSREDIEVRVTLRYGEPLFSVCFYLFLPTQKVFGIKL
mmetsp:Transcript_75343/g.87561  ORF Transcript_75343/g.87561 Transcript_75343/m.87561 type:complete len:84 (+) Transcript_75343:184-435(+)